MSKYLPPRTQACYLRSLRRIDQAGGRWKQLARSVRSAAVFGEHNDCVTLYVDNLPSAWTAYLPRKVDRVGNYLLPAWEEFRDDR
jgi:hypothetical protein